ncbi:hypothetical protein PVAP13_2KG499200 [Panicum virgatum]|uniref:Knottin scorpion toxin-like domain-containing protein n=1 Tax=Panicum virgatum TaxID=38727 RepID=A0A8T0WG15_PANVG|nr:hypothetical protein PVAP13_2KG499200 [Panicum virgatum]
MKGKIAATIACLVLLLLSLGAEAELCEKVKKSPFLECYKQYCIDACVSDGYTDGHCRGLVTSFCVCTKDCADGGKAPPPEDEPGSSIGVEGSERWRPCMKIDLIEL